MTRQAKVTYWFFGSLSAGALLLAVVLNNLCLELGADIVKDIGVVLGSICLLSALWNLVGGEPLSNEITRLQSFNVLAQDASRSGLVRIFVMASDIPMSEMESLIKKSKSKIDICGYTLHALLENKSLLDAIKDRASNGVEVRLIQLAQDNKALDYTVDNKNAMIVLMKDVEAAFVEAQKGLGYKHKANLQVRQLKDDALHISIRRFDDRLYVLHYLRSKNSPETPVYLIEGESQALFRAYISEFEGAFTNAEPLVP